MVGQAAAQASLSSCPGCLLRRKFAAFQSHSRSHMSMRPLAALCTMRDTPAGPTLGATYGASGQPCKRRRTAHKCCSTSVLATIQPTQVADLAEGLEAPVQLVYLVTLLGFLVVGAYLVVRQVLIRRELEEAAKTLGDRVRQKDATCEDYFELGVILLRKKLFTQATKNLEKAKKTWNGEPDELAQVYNALGFAYFNMERNELAQAAYRQAVDLQPGYVTAWNNLGDACEKVKDFENAYKAYKEALAYAPDNKVAQSRADALKNRVSSSRA
ncbi:TPA: hypothetical protein ACH3X3_007777 [Trebouxia sp. C0006]